MTTNQQNDLFIEWDLYEPKQQKLFLYEFIDQNPGNCSWDNFMDFLKEKLEIEGYWERVGLV